MHLCKYRGSSPHRNEEISTRPVHYDEINSMYYNPINAIGSQQAIRHVAQHEIQQPSIANVEDSAAHNWSNRKILPYAVHKFKPNEKNDSPRSSSDDSYPVPCRNYIELDIEKENENELQDMNTEEPEIDLDQSSDSSDNRKTNIKAIGRYEALKLCDMKEDSYKKYADIDE
ncbi:unnamed protein product [Mytilus coruscus]|uniref:Uncharacterized protein n=1 Tax=Mytilus coruscus TaxID=42192 RepID=A0A6J8AKJ3_MYTCO|nr:unnamed protein product [Mytilus coruscus]